ncbi:MAG: hypothetical protein OXF84_02515 [Bacteroidetes bacterium]|nr:hypothetical protein [Bacteroidota bacterium]
MSIEKINEALKNGDGPFYPEPLNGAFEGRGTEILLKKIKRERLSIGTTALRKRLARRFSIIGEVHQFMIELNNHPITIADRDDLSKVQFLWKIGESIFR